MPKNGAGNKPGALTHWWNHLWSSPLPTLGCDISQGGVSIARWSRTAHRLETVAWKPIAPGAVEASPLRENIQNPQEVRRAFAEALSYLGVSPLPDSSRRFTDAILVIPDQAARLFVLNFDTFPQKLSQGLPLVKWRLKKSVPFDIESAAISYFLQRSGTELQVVAAASPQSIIRQYEEVAESFGLRPRRVILSTLASLALAGEPEENLPLESQKGVLVAKYNPPWFTTAILQGHVLRLFRTVGLSPDGDGLLSSVDVLAAVYPSIAYFQDTFHAPLARGYLSGLGENSGSIAEALEQELNLGTSPLVPDLNGVASGTDLHRAERHFAALLGLVQEQQSE